MRRFILKILSGSLLVLVLALSASFSGQTFAADQIKVVYHLADGIDQASRAMANIRNHLRGEPDTKIVVVAIGDGIQFLLAGAKERNGKPFDAAVSALVAALHFLRSQGVEFRICNNTLAAHDVPLSRVLPEAKIVPAGVVEIARLQAKEGFVYLRP